MLWAVLMGVLSFPGGSVLPEMIGRGWTLIIFAAVPFVAGLPFIGGPAACRSCAGACWRRWCGTPILFSDAARMTDPPLPALIPLAAVGLAMWSAISVQAYAAWKRHRTSGKPV